MKRKRGGIRIVSPLLFFVLKAKSVVRPNTHTTDSITITLLFKVYFQKTF